MVIDVIPAMSSRTHLHDIFWLWILFIGVVRAYSGLKTRVCALKFSINSARMAPPIGRTTALSIPVVLRHSSNTFRSEGEGVRSRSKREGVES